QNSEDRDQAAGEHEAVPAEAVLGPAGGRGAAEGRLGLGRRLGSADEVAPGARLESQLVGVEATLGQPVDVLSERGVRVAERGDRVVEERGRLVANRLAVLRMAVVTQGLLARPEDLVGGDGDVVLPMTRFALGPAVRQESLLVRAAVEEAAVGGVARAADLRHELRVRRQRRVVSMAAVAS